MYIDAVVLSGLVIVLLTLAVFGYALWYFVVHVRQDEARANAELLRAERETEKLTGKHH